MNKKYIVIVTGAPATGKTTYGRKISKELGIPFFSKDRIKEILYDFLDNKNLKYEDKQKIGVSSYAILYYQAEELMKVGISFILESNFVKKSSEILKKLIMDYSYTCITIRFEAELRTLYKRFLMRENLPERHPCLISNGVFDDFEAFKNMSDTNKEFKINKDEIIVDSTDFSNINLEEIVREIKKKMTKEENNV